MSQTLPRNEIPWDSLRGVIEDLYLHQNKTNRNIIEYISGKKHGLTITKSQLEYQLKKWKLRKNMKKEDYLMAQVEIDRNNAQVFADQNAHEVYLNGVRQSARKLRKGLWRHNAREEARCANVSELRYYISDGLKITNPIMEDKVGGPPYDTSNLQTPNLRQEGWVVGEITNGPVANYDFGMGSLPLDLSGQIENSPHILEERLGRFEEFPIVPPKTRLSVSQSRETTFIRDFILRTLFVIENGYWDDLEWEPEILKLLKTHKLHSLLTCIINLGTGDSGKLGNYLVGAVFHRYQGKYNSVDLYILLQCGCKPSATTLETVYRCADVQKIQQVFPSQNAPDRYIRQQCGLAVDWKLTAIFEFFALPPINIEDGTLLKSFQLYWQGKLSLAPKNELLTFSHQKTVALGFTRITVDLTLRELVLCLKASKFVVAYLNCFELLMEAINNRHENVIGILSNKVDLGNPGYLLFAISAGDEATTKWLLDAGANPNRYSFIPGIQQFDEVAYSRYDEEEKISSLLEIAYSATPLSIALRSKFGKIVNLLLSAGADPNLTVSVPPPYTYDCTENDHIKPSWYEGTGPSNCAYLKKYFKEVSPLELAIVTGCGADILENLWKAGARFHRPETTWMVLLMYARIGSSEFNLAAEILLRSRSQSGNPMAIRNTGNFSLEWGWGWENLKDSELPSCTLVLGNLGSESWGLVPLQTYNMGLLHSMIYHSIRRIYGPSSEIIIDNLATLDNNDILATAYRLLEEHMFSNLIISCLDAPSRQRNSAKVMRVVQRAMRARQYPLWYFGMDFRGPLLESIIKSAWQGAIRRSALDQYLKYFSGSSQPNLMLSQISGFLRTTKPAGANIAKLLLESVNEREGKGRVVLDESVVEIFEYFIDAGWHVDERACHCGGMTALDIILARCVLDHTTFAMAKKLCNSGARINYGGYHRSALSFAIYARREIFRALAPFETHECWALRIIEFLLQVEEQNNYVYDDCILEAKNGVCFGTPLQEAAFYGDFKLATLLLKAGLGALLEISGLYSTPRQAPVIPCLELGMGKTFGVVPGSLRRTPLELAVEQGRQDMVVLLLQAGAKVTEEARQQAQSIPRILRLLPVPADHESSLDMLDFGNFPQDFYD